MRSRPAAFGRQRLEDADDAVETRDEERPEEERPPDGEDRGVAADPQREGRDREERESRRLRKTPQRVTQPAREIFHDHSSRSAVIGSTRSARRPGTTD